MALGTAFRAFFAALLNRQAAEQLQYVLDHPERPSGGALPSPAAAAPPAKEPAAPAVKPAAKEVRSEAVTLLATLQREARLIDLIQENLAQYSDAQIGAAARPCLQQCSAALERLFGLQVIEEGSEGDTVRVPENASPSRYQWIGEGSDASGKLVHHGWQAAHVRLPQWTGAETDAHVIAPVQIQRT